MDLEKVNIQFVNRFVLLMFFLRVLRVCCL
jgi:hypothetical protein